MPAPRRSVSAEKQGTGVEGGTERGVRTGGCVPRRRAWFEALATESLGPEGGAGERAWLADGVSFLDLVNRVCGSVYREIVTRVGELDWGACGDKWLARWHLLRLYRVKSCEWPHVSRDR